MLFLSQILGTNIYDSRDEKIGYIVDVLVKPQDTYPPVGGLEIDSKGKKLFVHYRYIESLGEKHSTLNVGLDTLKPCEASSADLFLAKDLLERQIVDLLGAKLVRVNDIQLGKIADKLCVISLAVGNKSIFRRLGFGFLASWLNLQDRFIRWDDVNLVDLPRKQTSDLQLKMIREELSQLHPADIANIVEDLNARQRRRFIEAISKVSKEFAADVLEEIDEAGKLKTLVLAMKADRAAPIVEEMAPDEAADLLANLPPEKTQEILKLMEHKESGEVEELLEYGEDSAGGLMSTHYVALPIDTTVKKTINFIRQESSEFESVYYVYGIDGNGLLQGVISLRTLLVSSPAKKIGEIMQTNMMTVYPWDSHQAVVRKMTRYNLLSICVVDQNKKLLGIVTVDDVLRLLVPEA